MTVSLPNQSDVYKIPFDAGYDSGWDDLNDVVFVAEVSGPYDSFTVQVTVGSEDDARYVASLDGDEWVDRAATVIRTKLQWLAERQGAKWWHEVLESAQTNGQFL